MWIVVDPWPFNVCCAESHGLLMTGDTGTRGGV